jgi:ribonucleoside-diphosphate reductase alpha chain
MLTLDIRHPDIEEFLEAKLDTTKITGANISVKVTDEFMNCVMEDKPFQLKFPINSDNIVKEVSAKKIWNILIKSSWKSAEPGILFWDTIIRNSPADCYEEFKTISVNPCSEITLSGYDSCRLLSVNLTKFVENPFTDESYFNYDKFIEVSKIAQRLSDDIGDLEKDKIVAILNKVKKDPESYESKRIEIELWEKILKSLQLGRRTGTSAIGLADTLAMLGYSYDSEESEQLSEDIYRIFAKSVYTSSIELAEERGSFPVFEIKREINHPFIKQVLESLPNEIRIKYYETGRRNIACLTIPPSGSLSLVAGISSGIEPVFNLSYTRRRKVNKNHSKIDYTDQNGDNWEEYNVLHPNFKNWIEITSKTSVSVNEMSDEDVKAWGEESPYNESTANEIDPIQKIKMIGKIQKWVDHSISQTTNLPEDITVEEISKMYIKAWRVGHKGFTVYREGSRSGVLVNKPKEDIVSIKYNNAPKRPKELPGEAAATMVKGEKFTVIVGLLNNMPYEVFAYKGNGILGKGIIIKNKRSHY